MTLNDIKKSLLKSKVNAEFSHYCAGNLYYTVDIDGKLYQFPIETVDKIITDESMTMKLSDDLGLTQFPKSIKASELNRWIGIAYEKGNFVALFS